MITTPLIVALDFPDSRSALALAEKLDPERCRLKVGKELFTRSGPAAVESLQRLGFEIFLDLKFHDIPNTVASACRAAAELGCWMVNVHAGGGTKMLEAASEAVNRYSTRPLLIGVTILTSLDDAALSELGYVADAATMTARFAGLAKQAGLDGVVSSAHDIAATKQQCGSDFLVVCPGIRPAGSQQGDQARIATPANAIGGGADFLVVGRPITQAPDPLAALAAIIDEIHAV